MSKRKTVTSNEDVTPNEDVRCTDWARDDMSEGEFFHLTGWPKDAWGEVMEVAARKDDQGKPDHRLLPFEAFESITRVMEFGASKYSERSWMGVSADRYVSAALRHLFAHCWGEKLDKESGLPHLAHAATSILFVLAKMARAEENK